MNHLMQFGGPVVWVLAIGAFCALLVFLERLLELRRAQIDYQDFLKGVINVLDAGNVDEALAICDDFPTPVANVTAVAVRHLDSGAEEFRDVVDSQARAEVGRLERRLGTLAIMGDVAPLLGLLGAVIGFIRTLLALNAGPVMSRASLLDGAMSALLPAAVGLSVTILVAVMHGSLKLRLERIVVEHDAAATRIVAYVLSRRGEK